MTPDILRQLAREAVANLQRAHDEWQADREAFDREFNDAVESSLAALPRGKVMVTRWKRDFRDLGYARKKLGEEAWKALNGPFEARAGKMVEAFNAKRDKLGEALNDALMAAPLSPGPEREWRRIADTDYNSQTNRHAYAKGSALMLLDVAELAGVKGRVEEYSAPVSERYVSTGWRVLVEVAEDLDLLILAKMPGPPLREQVRRCWARGVNPRVYNPFLPHGYEERVGLDYFGGEVKR